MVDVSCIAFFRNIFALLLIAKCRIPDWPLVSIVTKCRRLSIVLRFPLRRFLRIHFKGVYFRYMVESALCWFLVDVSRLAFFRYIFAFSLTANRRITEWPLVSIVTKCRRLSILSSLPPRLFSLDPFFRRIFRYIVEGAS